MDEKIKERLINYMKKYFDKDEKRIKHALDVLKLMRCAKL